MPAALKRGKFLRKKILFIFGTRPEAIKLAPVIMQFRKCPEHFEIRVCVSAQHREMLDQVLDFFDITPDYDLNIMRPSQTLFGITSAAFAGFEKVLRDYSPDWVIVQGDTTTTFVASLSAYYCRIKVAHIEAGLRSFRKFSPFPEEINRVLTTHIADLHFAPTPEARSNLLREGVARDTVFRVGNTVIDALIAGAAHVKGLPPASFGSAFKGIDFENFTKKIILVTGHRRESFGRPFREICRALKKLSRRKDVLIVYPVHLNPNVRKPVFDILKGTRNVHLIEPLEYPAFLWLMEKSFLILTDSCGVQEEAPSLGKPVLVMREVTERTEGIKAGTAKLVGTDSEKIYSLTTELLDHKAAYLSMVKSRNPYGDGKASARIREIIQDHS